MPFRISPQTRHFGPNETYGISIRYLKLKILTKVNYANIIQLKRGKITKINPDHIKEHANHFHNTS
ncbi:hypothetical protein H5410_061901 [Solanum commersonii]|uniref:Uncharacterized protein n=1 Tax=Solanum commersonii TaxID=4109 RepID=A0A9J5W9Y7_SOLCO|nr:hypothetical protein H5410_061901 [Solanum commersonii]